MERSALVVLAILLAFPPAVGSAGPGPQTYQGEYFYNFETAAFTPVGSKEAWCVNSAKLKAAMLPGAESSGGSQGTAFVVVRGVLSKKGHYCNLGAYKHILDVVEVLEIRDLHRQP